MINLKKKKKNIIVSHVKQLRIYTHPTNVDLTEHTKIRLKEI